jgi:hypothetical protein
MNSYYNEFEYTNEIIKEIKELKEIIKTQQEGVNAAAIVIDELRSENELLKKNLYLRELNNNIAKYKNLYNKAQDDYIELYKRYEQLMSKYIKL